MPLTQPDGILFRPTNGTGRPILMLHAWWGQNEFFKSLCSRLAEAGFLVFAPDLYHGPVVDTIPDAEVQASLLFGDLDKPIADVKIAAKYLSEVAGPDAGGMTVLGISLGAFFALDVSTTLPELVRSVVVYYGTRPGADYSASQADYLGHFAENDKEEPEPNVQELEAELKEAGRSVEFYRYPGTGHWFAEPDRPDAYNEAAANLAWERSMAFLHDPAR